VAEEARWSLKPEDLLMRYKHALKV